MKITTIQNGGKRIDFSNDFVIFTDGIDVSEDMYVVGAKHPKLELVNMNFGLLNKDRFLSKLFITFKALMYIWSK